MFSGVIKRGRSRTMNNTVDVDDGRPPELLTTTSNDEEVRDSTAIVAGCALMTEEPTSIVAGCALMTEEADDADAVDPTEFSATSFDPSSRPPSPVPPSTSSLTVPPPPPLTMLDIIQSAEVVAAAVAAGTSTSPIMSSEPPIPSSPPMSPTDDGSIDGSKPPCCSSLKRHSRDLFGWCCRHPFVLGASIVLALALISFPITIAINTSKQASMIDSNNGNNGGSVGGKDHNSDRDDDYFMNDEYVDEAYYGFVVDVLTEYTSAESISLLRTDPTSPQHKALTWLTYVDSLYLRDPELVLQRYALVVLYYATGGEDFWDDEWLVPGQHECTAFEGVVCDSETKKIIELHLIRRQLVGSIPSEIGLLTALQFLNLKGNRLVGTIPNAIYTSLTDLEWLDLSHNDLVGSIHSDIQELQNLIALTLSHNDLTGVIPIELPSAIEYLMLVANGLNGPLNRLTRLDTTTAVPGNSTKKDDEGGDEDTNAEDMNGNTEDDEEDAIFAMVSPFDRLKELRAFDIGENEISGTLPWSVGELSLLTSLGFHSTNMGGTLPSELGKLRLEKVSIGNTDVSGTIPDEFWMGGGKMQLLSMPNTDISGTLSSLIGLLTNLQAINLVNTEISGPIPSEIGMLSNLEWLQLAHTSISGSIPRELGLVTGLSTIWLHFTQLEGEVPAGMCQLPAVDTDFRTDCKNDEQVQCSCCTSCYGF